MRNKKFWDTTSEAKVTGRMQIWGTWEKEREKKGEWVFDSGNLI